jgi:hypothetical protein
MTSSGLEPATLGLVVWCLNQLRYRVPPQHISPKVICDGERGTRFQGRGDAIEKEREVRLEMGIGK